MCAICYSSTQKVRIFSFFNAIGQSSWTHKKDMTMVSTNGLTVYTGCAHTDYLCYPETTFFFVTNSLHEIICILVYQVTASRIYISCMHDKKKVEVYHGERVQFNILETCADDAMNSQKLTRSIWDANKGHVQQELHSYKSPSSGFCSVDRGQIPMGILSREGLSRSLPWHSIPLGVSLCWKSCVRLMQGLKPCDCSTSLKIKHITISPKKLNMPAIQFSIHMILFCSN